MVDSPFRLREIARRDMTALLAIERASFTNPWREADFENAFRRPGAFGLIADFDCDVRGYLIGEHDRRLVQLTSLCVDPQSRRRGIATNLIRAITRQLREAQSVDVLVGERNVRAQLFFRSQGFCVVSVKHNYWPASGDDAYLFEHCPGRQRTAFTPRNRVSAYLRRS